MTEMRTHLNFALRGAFFIAAGALLVWAFFPDAKQEAAGLMLGMVFSLINGWYLALKVHQFGELAAGNSQKRMLGLGFGVRAALTVMAVAVAVKREPFDVVFTLIGLAYVYIAILISGIIQSIKSSKDHDMNGRE